MVIADDAMAVDVDALTGGAPYHIVANLPYNVGTALFTRWPEPAAWPPRWTSLTLMFQLEVAERIVAPVGTNAYGRPAEIGRASCRESVCQDGSISVGAVSVKKKEYINNR